MAYQLGGALAGLYDPDDLEPLTTPYQKLRLGLEPPQSSPFYDLEHELAGRAAPVLYKNLSQDSDQGTRRVTDELVDQLLRARRARSINDPSGLDKLRSPDQVPQEPSFTERMLMDYLPRAGIFAADVSKPQIFHDYMTDAEKNWNEGNYGTAAAYLGLAPIGAAADVASTAILPASIEKSLGAGAARALSRAGRAADDALGGSRMAAGAGLAAGGAAMLPDDAEAGAPKWYSALERAIENAPQGKATIEQWLGYLRNRPGIKPEELEYVLGGKGANLDPTSKTVLTRDQLAGFTRGHKVGVDENYFSDGTVQYGGDDMHHGGDYSLPGPADDYREIMVSSPRAQRDENIAEGHFGPMHKGEPDVPNMDRKAGQQIGWIRGDVRKLDDGSRAFHVDEFQSDPAQRAQKLGWKSLTHEEDLSKIKQKFTDASREFTQAFSKLRNDIGEPELNWSNVEDMVEKGDPQAKSVSELYEKMLDVKAEYNGIGAGMSRAVPDRPWKKDWPKLLFRRALWEAVQEDADHLTWTPADIQQKRWGKAQLGRDRLYEETIPKIAADEAKRLGLPKESVGEVKGGSQKPSDHEFEEVSNDLITIEENYSGSQDRRDELDTMMKRLGLSLEVRKNALGLDPKATDWVDSAEDLIYSALVEQSGGSHRLFSLKLTPEIRKKILAEGLPTFVGAGVAPGLVERFLSEE